MSLIPIAEPQTESELAVVLCLLEGEGIPAFVQNGGFGSLHPGPQIAIYNARRVLVPIACQADAAAALLVLEPPLPDRITWRDRLRIVVELIVFGWFIPGSRRTRKLGTTDDGEIAEPSTGPEPEAGALRRSTRPEPSA